MTNEDSRKWKIVSDYLGNDPQAYRDLAKALIAGECGFEEALRK